MDVDLCELKYKRAKTRTRNAKQDRIRKFSFSSQFQEPRGPRGNSAQISAREAW